MPPAVKTRREQQIIYFSFFLSSKPQLQKRSFATSINYFIDETFSKSTTYQMGQNETMLLLLEVIYFFCFYPAGSLYGGSSRCW